MQRLLDETSSFRDFDSPISSDSSKALKALLQFLLLLLAKGLVLTPPEAGELAVVWRFLAEPQRGERVRQVWCETTGSWGWEREEVC